MDQQANQAALADKLREIAELEKKHNLLGVRFATKEGARVPGAEAADYVLRIIKRSLELIEKKDTLPRYTE